MDETTLQGILIFMGRTDLSKLPRLLYIGDLPIEATSGGQLLMFRLFKEYPPEKLMVIHSRNHGLGKHPDKELPGVKTYRIKSPHVLGTRFRPIGYLNRWINFLYIKYIVSAIAQKKVKEFRPDIIITVMHGYFWTTVQYIAKKNSLPYVLLIHDDWTITLDIQSQKEALLRKFYSAYKGAAECFCMSENMVDYYEQFTQRKGVVLPALGQEGIELNHANNKNPFLIMGYGGSLHRDYAYNFINTCHALDRIGGKMIAYTNVNLDHLKRYGLKSNNVEINAFVSAKELLKRLKDVDVLYLPMDFSKERKLNMMLAFPSKVPDYLILKKPLFIHAPAYSSIIKWAAQLEQNIGPVITTNDEDDIENALRQLLIPSVYNSAVKGINALGDNEFNPDKIRNYFYSRLMNIAQENNNKSE